MDNFIDGWFRTGDQGQTQFLRTDNSEAQRQAALNIQSSTLKKYSHTLSSIVQAIA